MVEGADDPKKIYLIDFGSSFLFTNGDGSHKIDKFDHTYTGNLMFSSMGICSGSSLSRRDDIESIIYMLIYMLNKNTLPWTKFQQPVLDGHLTMNEVRKLRSAPEMI